MEAKIEQVFRRFPKLTKVYVKKKTKEVSVSRKAGYEVLKRSDFLRNQRNSNRQAKSNK